MKSYFLIDIENVADVAATLSMVLPGQTEPWILWHHPDDPLAFFNISEADETFKETEIGTLLISADISGRHYNDDDAVIGVLSVLQRSLGGRIIDDD